jgi:hypothetical protein
MRDKHCKISNVIHFSQFFPSHQKCSAAAGAVCLVARIAYAMGYYTGGKYKTLLFNYRATFVEQYHYHAYFNQTY